MYGDAPWINKLYLFKKKKKKKKKNILKLILKEYIEKEFKNVYFSVK